MQQKIMVTRSSLPSYEEFIEEIKPIWDTRWLTNMGEFHKKLENELKRYMGVDQILLFSNGHMALELAIQAFELTGEVITTPFTFASTTHAIVRNGLTPVFCDIHEEDCTIDESLIESLITEKTSAIVAVHVYGNVCNIEKIQSIAQKYNLKVIYDAAHAFGVTYKGHGIGYYGDASMFSFHATKIFNTIEGGAVTFNDEQIGKRLYNLKNFGIKSPEEIDAVGCNAKMNEFQAAMGLCNLRYIDEEIQKRKKLYEYYIECLKDIPGVRCLYNTTSEIGNYAYFPVVFDELVFGASRDEVAAQLEKNGIIARKYFYPLTSEFKCYKDQYNGTDTPIAKRISEQILTLPFYGELEKDTVRTICDVIQNIKK